jgi:hypothetical protein
MISGARKANGSSRLPSSTEASFYPDIKVLLTAVMRNERLAFDGPVLAPNHT